MEKEELLAVFEKAGLARVSKDIDSLLLPSIRLHTTPVEESSLQIGVSKIGGLPDLPATAVWPLWQEVPQAFLAQIRLEELHGLEGSSQLPEQGMLWFFYNAQQDTYGSKPEDRGSWSVLLQQGEVSDLKRTAAPQGLPDEAKFASCSVRFSAEITLSQFPQTDSVNYDWTDEEVEKYEGVLSQLSTPEEKAEPRHRLLGHADTIQDDMRLQSQLISHGIVDVDDPRVEELSKKATDWRLLLQLDSDERIGMRWGSAGMLYYWILQADLQAHGFDTAWCVLQSD